MDSNSDYLALLQHDSKQQPVYVDVISEVIDGRTDELKFPPVPGRVYAVANVKIENRNRLAAVWIRIVARP